MVERRAGCVASVPSHHHVYAINLARFEETGPTSYLHLITDTNRLPREGGTL